MNNLIILPGLGMQDLTRKICRKLGVKPGHITYRFFSNGEIRPQISNNVRNKTVYLVQSTQTPHDNLMALWLTLDALRRSSVGKIIVVIPFFSYGRQERKDRPRVPISAKLFASFIEKAGANHVVCVDLHADAIQGFFDISCDHVYGSMVLIPAIKKYLKRLRVNRKKLVVVAPDKGRFEYNYFYAQQLGIRRIVFCGKRTVADNKKKVAFVDGEVPKNAVALMFDELVDTFGTLEGAGYAIKAKGAKKIIACGTHLELSGPAIERLENSPIDMLWGTDSIPGRKTKSKKIRIVSIAPLLAKVIEHIRSGQSISRLFKFRSAH